MTSAAQTVRRPVVYYSQLLEKERNHLSVSFLPNSKWQVDGQNTDSALVACDEESIKLHCLNVTEYFHLSKEDFDTTTLEMFPKGEFDQFGEPKDNRTHHSWTYKLPEVDNVELLETQMINNIAPTILVSKLMQVMRYDDAFNESGSENFEDCISHIINVASHEGIFNTDGKNSCHVPNNMSKAALGMLTRSAAPYYAKCGILMNSVDTGWISSAIKTFQAPPLSCEDGAYRILHPILTSSLEYGKLFKNYHQVDW